METNFPNGAGSPACSHPENAHFRVASGYRSYVCEPAPQRSRKGSPQQAIAWFNRSGERRIVDPAPDKPHLWPFCGSIRPMLSRKTSPRRRFFSRNASPKPFLTVSRPRNSLFLPIPQALTEGKPIDEAGSRAHEGYRAANSRNRSPSEFRHRSSLPESPHIVSRYLSRVSLNPITDRSRQSSRHLPQSFTQPVGDPCPARVSQGVNVFN